LGGDDEEHAEHQQLAYNILFFIGAVIAFYVFRKMMQTGTAALKFFFKVFFAIKTIEFLEGDIVLINWSTWERLRETIKM